MLTIHVVLVSFLLTLNTCKTVPCSLIHFSPIFHFYTRRKIKDFERLYKWNIGLKRINIVFLFVTFNVCLMTRNVLLCIQNSCFLLSFQAKHRTTSSFVLARIIHDFPAGQVRWVYRILFFFKFSNISELIRMEKGQLNIFSVTQIRASCSQGF